MALPSPSGDIVPVVPLDSRNGKGCALASQSGEASDHMKSNNIVAMVGMQPLTKKPGHRTVDILIRRRRSDGNDTSVEGRHVPMAGRPRRLSTFPVLTDFFAKRRLIASYLVPPFDQVVTWSPVADMTAAPTTPVLSRLPPPSLFHHVHIAWQARPGVCPCVPSRRCIFTNRRYHLTQRRPVYAETTGIPCRSTYGVPASCQFAPRRII